MVLPVVYINQKNYFTINTCDIYNHKIAYKHATLTLVKSFVWYLIFYNFHTILPTEVKKN